MSRVYDDYDDYMYLCKVAGEVPLNVRDEKSFYTHEDEIFKKHGVKNHHEFYAKIKESNKG